MLVRSRTHARPTAVLYLSRDHHERAFDIFPMLKPGIIAEPPRTSPRPDRSNAWPSRWLFASLFALALGYLSLNEYRAHRRASDSPQCPTSGRSRVPSGTRNPAYLIKARNGAVASENEICSEIGVSTLKAGGNAVDAIVSTTLCIGVTNMFS